MWLFDLFRRRFGRNVNYRLDCNPSAYYASQFEVDKLHAVPIHTGGALYGRPSKSEEAICSINAPVDFQVCIPCKNRQIEDRHVEIAKQVLNNVVEMDRSARDQLKTDPTDYGEHLAYIEIDDDIVHLHYFASTMNTEWGAYFGEQADGTWAFEHIG